MFATMASEGLLDLETRAGKQLGGYCSSLPLRRRPFIFMNGTGTHDDVQTLLHEAGHAFHAFAKLELPLIWQTVTPMEFNEVASMAMELLAAPYLTRSEGGFYRPAEAARARIEHLEGIILFLPYMAVVDAFQHWVYTHVDEAQSRPISTRPGTLSGNDLCPSPIGAALKTHGPPAGTASCISSPIPSTTSNTAWLRSAPSRSGATACEDPDGALAAYRTALAAGGTRTLPELFRLAGAEFRFDAELLSELVALMETTIASLEAQA
jgi:oligoendopeptidase F